MRWKIYFWFYLIVSAIGILASYGDSGPITLGDWLSLTVSILGGIALFSYIFGNKTFNQNFWKVIFWIIVADFVVETIWQSTPLNYLLPFPEFLKTTLPKAKYFFSELIGLTVSLPMYYAIYKLGKGKVLKIKK